MRRRTALALGAAATTLGSAAAADAPRKVFRMAIQIAETHPDCTVVGVDREACAHYKHALDEFLPPEYSAVVYTGSNNDRDRILNSIGGSVPTATRVATLP